MSLLVEINHDFNFSIYVEKLLFNLSASSVESGFDSKLEKSNQAGSTSSSGLTQQLSHFRTEL